MLFDLRSRGRRRTVQVIYIGLAVLIGAGLILFGVGTGSGGGGLLGSLTGSGSSSAGSSAVQAATKKALAATKANPQSASAWASLVAARQSAANSVGYDSNTNAYTATGKQQLAQLLGAYGHYTKLVKTPSTTTATLAARAYSALGQYKSSAGAYQTVLAAEPGGIHGLECVAMESYAAGNTRVGQLAEARVLTKIPKTARKETKSVLEAPKKTPSAAAQSC